MNRTVQPRRQLIAYIGKNYKIPCPVMADPPAIMEWSKEGQPIHSGWERFKVVDTGLRIKEIENEDGGYYNCKATNGYGSVNINFTLTILRKLPFPFFFFLLLLFVCLFVCLCFMTYKLL